MGLGVLSEQPHNLQNHQKDILSTVLASFLLTVNVKENPCMIKLKNISMTDVRMALQILVDHVVHRDPMPRPETLVGIFS